jgi:hypothetical protein
MRRQNDKTGVNTTGDKIRRGKEREDKILTPKIKSLFA